MLVGGNNRSSMPFLEEVSTRCGRLLLPYLCHAFLPQTSPSVGFASNLTIGQGGVFTIAPTHPQTLPRGGMH